ncbi:hypothetical protein EUGRSUZ_H04789 [Eucalyptus grandis]|uniref:Uncharacterized protein n=2 Tax=Eucalyptus grandis TaxID=71139 RepID=A0ACC3JZJ2_EUCGR|nr:hypothetical protein EUGRSUZ_H04789 [Eucalyptus grandis]
MSNSCKEDMSVRLACPNCSSEGSPVFNAREAIAERSAHISRVKSPSNFSSITSTFKSELATMPVVSGALDPRKQFGNSCS